MMKSLLRAFIGLGFGAAIVAGFADAGGRAGEGDQGSESAPPRPVTTDCGPC